MNEPSFPCSREEWEASVDALNQARADVETARVRLEAARARVRDNLLSQGVIPREL